MTQQGKKQNNKYDAEVAKRRQWYNEKKLMNSE